MLALAALVALAVSALVALASRKDSDVWRREHVAERARLGGRRHEARPMREAQRRVGSGVFVGGGCGEGGAAGGPLHRASAVVERCGVCV